MSRHIDAEWLKAFFEADKGKDRMTPIDSLLALIDDAPSIKTKQTKYYDEDEKVWKIGEVIIDSSENPNNCEYAENPSGDVWECGCFLDTYCEHQIYDINPDGTINIVECGYEPKDEP